MTWFIINWKWRPKLYPCNCCPVCWDKEETAHWVYRILICGHSNLKQYISDIVISDLNVIKILIIKLHFIVSFRHNGVFCNFCNVTHRWSCEYCHMVLRAKQKFRDHIMPIHFNMESESIRNGNKLFSNRDFVSLLFCCFRETKNWSDRNEIIETSGRLHPS